MFPKFPSKKKWFRNKLQIHYPFIEHYRGRVGKFLEGAGAQIRRKLDSLNIPDWTCMISVQLSAIPRVDLLSIEVSETP